jgi:hypothetical protein
MKKRTSRIPRLHDMTGRATLDGHTNRKQRGNPDVVTGDIWGETGVAVKALYQLYGVQALTP